MEIELRDKNGVYKFSALGEFATLLNRYLCTSNHFKPIHKTFKGESYLCYILVDELKVDAFKNTFFMCMIYEGDYFKILK